jgi:hypothetical protein
MSRDVRDVTAARAVPIAVAAAAVGLLQRATPWFRLETST